MHVEIVSVLLWPQEHLQKIMVGLREFIPDHKKLPIEQAFTTLREEINYEEAVNQINLALYIFQDAVSVPVLGVLVILSPLLSFWSSVLYVFPSVCLCLCSFLPLSIQSQNVVLIVFLSSL